MVTGWPNMWSSTDNAFYFIIVVSAILFLGITGTLIYFVNRFSFHKNPEPKNISGNTFLEIAWTVIPTLLVLAMFWAGWKGFIYKRTVPKDAIPINVTARQWSWSFEYENGKTASTLEIPFGKPVKLNITSVDVVHSLFIPAFRVKEDAVPGRKTYLWFKPEKIGTFDLFCTEYCGVQHAKMITKVNVVPHDEFLSWLNLKEVRAETVPGEILAREKGCLSCHSTDGTESVGPTFKGLFGRSKNNINVDENFIRKKIFEGSPPIMPSLKDIVNDEEAGKIIEYIKTLK